MLVFYVILGGALGGAARFLASRLVGRLWGSRFPWGTLCVNVLGSGLLGLSLGLAAGGQGLAAGAGGPAFFAIGFCGGLTTFSAFSLESFELLSRGARGAALGNLLGSVVLCGLAALSGYLLGGGPTG